MSAAVLPELTATVRAAAHRTGPAGPCACAATDSVLADRPDVAVVRHGDTVAKAHAAGTDPAALARRTAVAAHPALREVLLAPLDAEPAALHGRLVTLWPHGEPVDPQDPDAAPWEGAGRLLAALHRTDPGALGGQLPPMRGPSRAARAVARLRAVAPGHPATPAVLVAWGALPGWARAELPMPRALLCHGDVHLGQLVRTAAGGWRLIDVDDLGLGDPAWDLARPAAWYACGILDAAEWTRFLTAYREGGGPALPPGADPWSVLDVPARAVTVQSAALALVKSTAAGRELDEAERCVVTACERIAALAAGPALAEVPSLASGPAGSPAPAGRGTRAE